MAEHTNNNTGWDETRAVAYYRLSREDGDGRESDSIANQRKLIRAYLAENGISLVGEASDDGYTGANFDRPGFREVLEAIRSGRANCVVVKDLSRLGREYIETGRYLESVFPQMGVRFIAVNDHVDSQRAQSGDDILIPVRNIMNESYCRELSGKLRRQFRVQRENGEFLGAFACFGYLKSPEDRHRLIVDDSAAEIVREIFSLKLQGCSQQAIAARLNAEGIPSPAAYKKAMGSSYRTGFSSVDGDGWCASAVRSILTNPVYIGTLVQGKRGTPNFKVKQIQPRPPEKWTVVPHCHEPVVDPLVFESVQRMLERDTRTAPGRQTVYPLSGVLFCGDCGRAMQLRSVRRNGRVFRYYVCGGYKRDGSCRSHSIRQEELEEAVRHAIVCQIQMVAGLEDLLNCRGQKALADASRRRLDRLTEQKNRELDQLQNFRMKLYEALCDKLIERDEYEGMRSRYTERIHAVREELASLKAEQPRDGIGFPEKRNWILQYALPEGGETLTRESVAALIDRVTVFEEKRIRIDFNFRDEIADCLALAESVGKEVS